MALAVIVSALRQHTSGLRPIVADRLEPRFGSGFATRALAGILTTAILACLPLTWIAPVFAVIALFGGVPGAWYHWLAVFAVSELVLRSINLAFDGMTREFQDSLDRPTAIDRDGC